MTHGDPTPVMAGTCSGYTVDTLGIQLLVVVQWLVHGVVISPPLGGGVTRWGGRYTGISWGYSGWPLYYNGIQWDIHWDTVVSG